jgi:hypothetical protein
MDSNTLHVLCFYILDSYMPSTVVYEILSGFEFRSKHSLLATVYQASIETVS